MTFGERIAQLRTECNMTQAELGELIGVSGRSIRAYENGSSHPRKYNLISKLAGAFNMTATELLRNVDDAKSIKIPKDEEQEKFLESANIQYGSRGRRQAEKLMDDLGGMFAGGELSEEDKDAVFQTFTEIYFMSKKEAKKYTPKKYMKNESDE